MKLGPMYSMQSKTNTEITVIDVMKTLEEIRLEISQLNKMIENVSSRLEFVTDLLQPDEESELIEYLQQTMDAINKLDEINHGMPISRIDLAEELDIHHNTAYVRAEKLVQKKKLQKFYGRELGFTRFEEKKAVYYTLPRTLYDTNFLEWLSKENRAAHMIGVTLLQQQPLTEQTLLQSNNLSEFEIKSGLLYLLNRGLIIRETKDNMFQYRIRKIEVEKQLD